MKTVWIAGLAIAASTSAFAQSTIYKHVDDSGRVTYSNKPMKGAVGMELEPLTTIPGTPAGMLTQRPAPSCTDGASARRRQRGQVAVFLSRLADEQKADDHRRYGQCYESEPFHRVPRPCS